MATPDEQLVKLVTEQVLAALRAKRTGTTPARIDPAIGVCTGDYSQFTDRPDLAGGGGGGRSAKPQAAMSPQPVALGGIVTADQLQHAIASSSDGIALLAADARLTPLAADFAREHPEKVRRGAGAANRRSGADAASTPWLWWADGHCPAVQSVTGKHRQRLRPSAAGRNASGLLQVVRDLKAGLADHSLTGGLLFVASAARAALLAYRCPGVRAVVGTCQEAVDEAIRDLGANVLIVEYPYTNEQKLASMVDAMLSRNPEASPHLERELAELHRSPGR